ncbi:MAG: glycosyltransferase family 39 protein [Microbacteriaceae bacterium]|nr:glycosyltransferase family 39 protein [Microbacteriaceae bacterium]
MAEVERFDLSARSDRVGGSLGWLRAAVWLGPILLASAASQATNFAGAPLFTETEGSLAASAWSLLTGAPQGFAAEATPVVGAGQIASWIGITRGFDRYDSAIAAAREPMVAIAVLSVLLLWLLVRRLGYSYAAASGAALIFALSPLAVGLHRMASLDNLAAGWMLLALVCALTEGRQLRGSAVSAAAAGIAVLTRGDAVLLLPLVAWLMIRAAEKDTRRYVLSVAGAIFALVIGGSLVVAVLLNAPSPLREIAAGFSGRASIGSILAPGSTAQSLAASWFSVDPILAVATALALIAGLAIRRLRPLALTLLLVIIVWLVPGGVAVASPAVALLLAAVLVAALAEWSARTVSARTVFTRTVLTRFVLVRLPRVPRRSGVRQKDLGADRRADRPAGRGAASVFALALGCVSVLLAGAVIAVPQWGHQLGTLLHVDANAPVHDAEKWMAENLPKNSRLLVDNSVRVDLVRRGFAVENVVWAAQLDSNPAVRAQSPRGWRDADFILTSGASVIATEFAGSASASASASERFSAAGSGSATSARANSTVIASFGVGRERAQVSRINPLGRVAEERSQREIQARRASSGRQLFENPGLRIPAGSRSELLDGRVDERITIAVGQLLAAGAVEVAGFPERVGESGMVRRQVVVAALNGEPMVRAGQTTAVSKNLLASLTGDFRAESARATPAGLLITFSILSPRGLVQ